MALGNNEELLDQHSCKNEARFNKTTNTYICSQCGKDFDGFDIERVKDSKHRKDESYEDWCERKYGG